MRTIRCHCGAEATSPGGFLKNESTATGFCPVVGYGGGVRWFCPEHARQVAVAVEALKAACGGDVGYLLPPMLREMGWS
jgi:hypothetical protein